MGELDLDGLICDFLLAVSLLGTFGLPAWNWAWPLKAIFLVALIFGATWGLLSSFSGFALDELAKRLRYKIEGTVSRALLRRFKLLTPNEGDYDEQPDGKSRAQPGFPTAEG